LVTAAHLPAYPSGEATAPAPSTTVVPARQGFHRAVAIAGALVIALLVLGWVRFIRSDGEAPHVPDIPAVVATTPTVDPFAEGSGIWGTLATPPPAPGFVVFGQFVFDAGWKGTAQTLPGPMIVYVAPQPAPPTVWFGAPVTLMRAATPGTPVGVEEIAAGSYLDLRADDQLVVPANTPFAVEAGQYDPAALATLIILPVGAPVIAPDAVYWEWWSWGQVETWPSGPVEVQFEAFELSPGESVSLPEHSWPRLVYVDTSSAVPLRLMLTAGTGETTAVGGIEGNLPIDTDTSGVSTPGTIASLPRLREPVVPGVEATLGGTLLAKAAFLDPGAGGALRNPSEARDTVAVIMITFGPAGGDHASRYRAPSEYVANNTLPTRGDETAGSPDLDGPGLRVAHHVRSIGASSRVQSLAGSSAAPAHGSRAVRRWSSPTAR
jgi:hypothetical protein